MELCNKYAEKHIVLEKYLDGMNSCDASAGIESKFVKKHYNFNEIVDEFRISRILIIYCAKMCHLRVNIGQRRLKVPSYTYGC